MCTDCDKTANKQALVRHASKSTKNNLHYEEVLKPNMHVRDK